MKVKFYCPVCLNYESAENGTVQMCDFCRAEMACTGMETDRTSYNDSLPFIEELKSRPEFNEVLYQARLSYNQSPEQREKRLKEWKREKEKRDAKLEADLRELRYHVKQCPGTGGVRCPHCNSDQITTGARGWKWTTGFIGSGKTVNRCANCGHTWEPRKR